MQDNTMLLVILAVVSVATTLQAVAMAGAFIALKRMEEKVDRAEQDLKTLRPHFEGLGRLIDILAQWTDNANEQVPLMAQDVRDAVDRFRGAARSETPFLLAPLGRLGAVIAFWKGMKRGLRFYQEFRSSRPSAAGVRS